MGSAGATLLIVLGALLPALPLAGALPLADNTPLLDSLDGASPRDDHSFTGAAGTWSVAGTLLYEQAGNSGDLRAELRRNSTSGALLAYDPLGNFYTRSPLSVLAVDGGAVGASDTYFVSEILNNVAPSYAVEFEGAPLTVLGSPFNDASSMGPTGVVQSYQVFLNKRDTVDVRLSVPPSFTYNYNLQLYLFGGAATPYYSSSGSVSPGPALVSGGPMNSVQHLRFIAPADAWYLLVVGNTKELMDVPYNLTVVTNGLTLADGGAVTGTVDTYNRNEDFAFGNAASDWGFVAVRTDNPGYGEWLTAELHAPTFDSNVLASESPTTGSQRAGVIALNRYEPGTPNASLLTVRWGPSALYPVAYTLQMDNRVPLLSSNLTPTRFTFAPGQVLRGASVALNRGETVDLHAAVDAFFTYPYELQIIVFGPGSNYYSASGAAQAGPVAAVREGPNAPKDLVFTAGATGFYGIALLSLNSTYSVPVDFSVNIQGWPLAHNDVAVGALSDADTKDLASVAVDADRWGVVAGRLVAGSGSYVQRLHAAGFDTTPVAWDLVGTGPSDSGFALEAVNGYLAAPATYYVSIERASGAPTYALEYDAAPLPLARDSRTNVSVPDGQIVSGYEVNLNAGETVDFRLRVDAGFSYPYTLRLYLFSPANPYYSGSARGAPAALATSAGTANTEQDMLVVAPVTGSYLVVLANLGGNLSQVPATVEVQVDGEPIGLGLFAIGDLNSANRVDYYSFGAPALAWTVASVKVGASSGASDTLVHSLHTPSADSLSLATDRARGVGAEGVIVVDGSTISGNTTFYLAEAASLAPGSSMTYQVQVASSFPPLPPVSQVASGTLAASSQFAGYTMQLARGQSLDLRLRRAEGFSYPYNLGLFVFAPGAGNASTSAENGAGPVLASANGPSVEQDGMFTAAVSGSHLILIVNLDVPRQVNYTLNLTVDGWLLQDDTHLAGDLNGFNRADQYRFDAAPGAWSAAGVRWTGGTGAVRGGLHTLGLNTLPLATVDASATSPVAVLPLFAAGTNASAPSTFFLNVTMAPVPGNPTGEYFVDFSAATSTFSHNDIGATQSFTMPSHAFLALHTLDLAPGDSVDIRVLPNATYTKEFDLNLALYAVPLAPAVLQATPLLVSKAPPNMAEAMTFVAADRGPYLLVVENALNLDTIPYMLSVTGHTVFGSPPGKVNVTLTAGRDYIEVTWSMSQETDFLAYEVWYSTDPAELGRQWDRISVREATADKIDGPDILPGQVYTVRVLVYDKENLLTQSDPVGVQTVAKTIWEETSFQLLVVAGIVIAFVVIFAYWRARAVRSGRPFRLRSPKAEAVVEERGPKGRSRPPKDEAAIAVPAAPSKGTQDAVDYMQRVMKGGK